MKTETNTYRTFSAHSATRPGGAVRQAAAVLLLMLLTMTAQTARADYLKEGKWYYMIVGDGAKITGYYGDKIRVTDIIIPETLGGKPVTGFSGFTFEGFTALATIEFSANSKITTIPTDFARGCANLRVVAVTGNTSAGGYSLPASITTVEAGAFAGTKIDQLNMPSVTAIGGSSTHANSVGAFEGCNSLSRLTIGQAATIADDAFADIDVARYCFITYNGPQANWSYKAYRRSPNVLVFCNDGSCGWAGDTGTQNCVYWTRDTKHNVLMACDDADAYRQHPTEQARLNDNWATKKDGTLDNTMKTLTMRNVYSTGAWSDRKTLETVTLQEGVTAIDEYAFWRLTALTSVSMTADVTTIGQAAFMNCTSLKDLYFEGSKAQWNGVTKNIFWNAYVSSAFQVHWCCTATFDTQGHGTSPAAQTVWNGKTLTPPADPAAQGYEFAGWYSDAACTEAFDFSAGLDDDVTVYARWTPLTNTILFDLGGKGTPVSAQTVTSGQTVTEPAVQYTAAEGIEGWYTDADRQQRYDFTTAVDHSTTLYAKWAPAGTATISLTGGEGGTVVLTDAQGRTPNAEGRLISGTYTLTVTPSVGYSFSGTYTLTDRSSGASTPPTTIDGSAAQTYTLDLTEDDAEISIAFTDAPILTVTTRADDANVLSEVTWSVVDGLKEDISYSNGSAIPCDDGTNPILPADFGIRLNVDLGSLSGYAFTATVIDRGSGTTTKLNSLQGSSFLIHPRGSIRINILVYKPHNITLQDADSNSQVIEANEGIVAGSITLQGRTLRKDGQWSTLCLPFSVGGFSGTPLEGATVMSLSTGKRSGTGFDAASGELKLNFTAATSITAGKAYIVRWERPADYDGNESSYDISNPTFTDVAISSTTPTASTSYDKKVSFVGTYSPVSRLANDRSTLCLADDNTLGWPHEDGQTEAFRAYLKVELPMNQWMLTDIILGRRDTRPDADVNGDAQVNILDITTLIDDILNNRLPVPTVTTVVSNVGLVLGR